MKRNLSFKWDLFIFFRENKCIGPKLVEPNKQTKKRPGEEDCASYRARFVSWEGLKVMF